MVLEILRQLCNETLYVSCQLRESANPCHVSLLAQLLPASFFDLEPGTRRASCGVQEPAYFAQAGWLLIAYVHIIGKKGMNPRAVVRVPALEGLVQAVGGTSLGLSNALFVSTSAVIVNNNWVNN